MKVGRFDERDFHWRVKEIAKNIDELADKFADLTTKIGDNEWLVEELEKFAQEFAYQTARIIWWNGWLEKYIEKLKKEVEKGGENDG